MMGPLLFNQKFKPGTMVILNPSTAIYHDRRSDYGTVIDNFVDVDISTGKRTERVLVMWPDAATDWLDLYQVLLLSAAVES